MKKTLVPGGTGCFGKFLIEVFTRQNYLVRPLSCHKKLGKSGPLGEPADLSKIGYFRLWGERIGCFPW